MPLCVPYPRLEGEDLLTKMVLGKAVLAKHGVGVLTGEVGMGAAAEVAYAAGWEDGACFSPFFPSEEDVLLWAADNEDVLQHDIQDEHHARARDETGFWGRQGAGVIFLAKDTGRVLLAQRSTDVLEPLTWGTWGGAIDNNEDPRQAASREVVEEAGYDGQFELIPLLVYENGSFRYHNFLAIVPGEFDPTLNWETNTFAWVTLGEWPSDLHFGLQALLAHEPSMTVLSGLVGVKQERESTMDEPDNCKNPPLPSYPRPPEAELADKLALGREVLDTYDIKVMSDLYDTDPLTACYYAGWPSEMSAGIHGGSVSDPYASQDDVFLWAADNEFIIRKELAVEEDEPMVTSAPGVRAEDNGFKM
jgi:8-oxo-dGTP pyrophosphatase MutT (NUDIX family)